MKEKIFRSNIVLIGMPGSGKSTVGVLLAKLLAKRFVDSDILIQNHCEQTLQQIIDSKGHLALRQIEEEVVLGMTHKNHVIATGGSVPYSDAAMQHLKKEGLIAFLQTDMKTLRQRVHNYDTRGIARRPEQSMDDLFEEREVLYKKYAEITVDCIKYNQDEVAEELSRQIAIFFTKP